MNSIKPNRAEIHTFIYAGIALSIFIIIQILNRTVFYQPFANYLIIHTLLEMFSIFVSFSIFFHGWFTFNYHFSLNKMIVSILFFQVGTYDIFHTLFYEGMPFYQNAGSVNRATWFWILGRLTEVVGIAYVFVLGSIKWKVQKITKMQSNFMFYCATAITAALSITILTLPEKLPILVIEGHGVTSIKMMLEYFVCFILIITMFAILKIYKRTKNGDLLVIFTGLIFLLLGELVFTIYIFVHGIDNLLGHIYKLLGYFFLMKGMFFPQFTQIFREKEIAQTKWHEAEQKLIDHEKTMSSLIIAAQEEERKRVSRELHDGIGQELYSIFVTLKMLQNQNPKYKEELKIVEEMTGNTMKEVKRIAASLRPSSLDDLGLIPALRSYCEQFETTHQIKVQFKYDKVIKRLYPDIETAIYRIFQEFMTNSAKYSKAENIIVELKFDSERIVLFIEDDGIGFNMKEVLKDNRTGIGLYSMQERAQIVGGMFTLDSEPNKGTMIEVEIPIK